MNPVTSVIGFVPLVLFALLDGRISVTGAAGISAVVAVVVFAVTVRRAFAVLPIVQAVTLAVMCAIAAGDPASRDVLTTYGRGIASLVIAAYILITVNFAPFTAPLARAGVPRERWTSRTFIDLNRRISAAWGFAVLILGLSHLLYGAVGSSLPRRQAHLLDWAPTIIAVILALRYTQRTVAAATTGGARPTR